MASGIFIESIVEDAVLARLDSLGYTVLCGLDIAADERWVKDVESVAETTA